MMPALPRRHQVATSALGSSHDAPGGNAPSRGGVSSTLGPGATKHPSAGKAPSSTRPNLVSTTPALPNAVLCQMSVEMDFATNQQHAWSPQHRWPLLPNLISGATCLLGPRCMHACNCLLSSPLRCWHVHSAIAAKGETHGCRYRRRSVRVPNLLRAQAAKRQHRLAPRCASGRSQALRQHRRRRTFQP